ncbi:fibronectin type III domain-containing protein [Eubacterium coprostanoligenes]|uniref:fibronectin type III domain-containing protein n=1 Tax=Eubacterium coprostanoligenes TaxID=290054 RepID=UPI002A7F5701|nr:fibronectin type III domain-containing protein [Eubacterium coprostanoligenes]MDY4698767.1 fibronectin type III domain-containing protein [Eubacterium coprostanoligenes]
MTEKNSYTASKSSKVYYYKVKAVVVTWKPAKNVTGYEIQVATDKKFKKNKKSVKVNKKKAKKKTVKNLKKNKKYYVRVRSYKIVNGKKVYGKWSKVKAVKTK